MRETEGLCCKNKLLLQLWISTRTGPPDEGLTETGPQNWVGFDELVASVTKAVDGRAEVLVQPRHTLAGLGGCSNVEIMPLGQSKGAAMTKVLEWLNISPDSMMALGDGSNDLDMLRLAGTSVRAHRHAVREWVRVCCADDVTCSYECCWPAHTM